MKTLNDIMEEVKNGAPFLLWRNIDGGYDWHVCTLFNDGEEIRFFQRGGDNHDDFTCFTENYLDGQAVLIQEPEIPE